jgi:hypothetical protein
MWSQQDINMCVKQTCTKNSTASKIITTGETYASPKRRPPSFFTATMATQEKEMNNHHTEN